MRFRPDDLDWAMGELLALFDRAGDIGVYPHLLDPDLFHEAWWVLNRQPFQVAAPLHAMLMEHFRPLVGSASRAAMRATRYENPVPA